MSATLAAFMEKMAASRKARTNEQPLPSEIASLCARISNKVDEFLQNSNLIGVGGRNRTADLNSGVSLETIGGYLEDTAVDSLVQGCGIPMHHQDAAAMSIGQLVAKHFVGDRVSVWSDHGKIEDTSRNQNFVALESLFSPVTMNTLQNSVSLEAFGVNINTTVPDLKAAIVVSLMNFHMGVAPRLMPVRTTSSPAVRYDVTRLEAYDVDAPETAGRTMLELYQNPTLVGNVLKTIVPLTDNDSEENPVLVADGQIAFNTEANILQLSIADAVGYERINRTDIVADGVKLATLTLTLTPEEPGVAETFTLPVPMSIARFSRTGNTEDAADRLLTFTHEFYLTSDTLTSAGEASVILAACGEGEGIKVKVRFSGQINLRTGVVLGQGSILSLIGHSPTGVELSVGLAALLATELAWSLASYSLDARFSEENMRKTSIAIRSLRRSLEYQIPTGRNYVVDMALAQADDESSIASVANIQRIGEDHVALVAIEETLGQVAAQLEAYRNGVNTAWTVGHYYAAGHRVRPAVEMRDLDMSDVTGIRDSDRSGDIAQRVKTFLTGVTASLQSASLFSQQLTAGSRPTYRAVTHPFILDTILGLPHIHNHLNKETQGRDNGGVEYRMVLDNGVVIEFVTSTFSYVEGKIVLMPYIPNSAESELNFGHLWDFGTLVGAYQAMDGRQANRRIYANTRQLPIPTNPMGAIITVTGIEEATFLETE